MKRVILCLAISLFGGFTALNATADAVIPGFYGSTNANIGGSYTSYSLPHNDGNWSNRSHTCILCK